MGTGKQVPWMYMQQVLYVGYSFDMQSTADQLMVKCYDGTAYIVTDVIARHRSGGASVTCAGGVYDAPSKGGNAVVAAVQSWVTLASGIIVFASMSAALTKLLTTDLYLSLTTGSTAACRADIYVVGLDVS